MTKMAVAYNRWDLVEPVSLDKVHKTVSIIVPAKTTQMELDFFVRALEGQNFPRDLLEVVIVDHGSNPPLSAPASPVDLRVLRLDFGFGPGAARAYGAADSNGDILLFVDVDVLLESDAVYEFVARTHTNPLVVGLGFRDFVNTETISPELVRQAILEGELRRLHQNYPAPEGQIWIDNYLARSGDNLEWRDDLWVVVVGAGLATSREMYNFSGGFSDFPVHGVEDTEFGWRLFQSGAVIWPNRKARGYHMGLRSISKTRETINRNRSGVLANIIPHLRHRPPAPGRRWTVPKVFVSVSVAHENTLEQIRGTTDDLLASYETDLFVVINMPLDFGEEKLLESFYANDHRVFTRSEAEKVWPLAVPFVIDVRAGARFSSDAIPRMLSKIETDVLGALFLVLEYDDVTVEARRNWVASRSHFLTQYSELGEMDAIRAVANDAWGAASEYGVSRDHGASSVEKHGGIYRLTGDTDA